jgi:hypothetical protein
LAYVFDWMGDLCFAIGAFFTEYSRARNHTKMEYSRRKVANDKVEFSERSEASER